MAIETNHTAAPTGLPPRLDMATLIVALMVEALVGGCGTTERTEPGATTAPPATVGTSYDEQIRVNATRMLEDGKADIPLRHVWFGGFLGRDAAAARSYCRREAWRRGERGKSQNGTDSRLENAEQYPVAAKAGWGHKRDETDLITAKLPALHFYQLAMPTPKAPEGSYDTEAARRGQGLFNGNAKCSSCHVPPIFTEPGYNLHKADKIGIDSFQADRGPERRYVTTPLRALFDTQKIHKGGFYHRGHFATLEEVVQHYDGLLKLRLSDAQKKDVVEYLKSI